LIVVSTGAAECDPAGAVVGVAPAAYAVADKAIITAGSDTNAIRPNRTRNAELCPSIARTYLPIWAPTIRSGSTPSGEPGRK
jgi:hypothetical protein